MNNQAINSFIETIKIGYLYNMKSGININETMIAPLIFILLSYIFSNQQLIESFTKFFLNIISCTKPNCIVLEGKRCFKINDFNTRSDQLFSNRFKAIWHYISKHTENNKSIYKIKEFAESSNIYDENGDVYGGKRNVRHNNKKVDLDMFVVNQSKYFILCDNVYCKVTFYNEKMDNKTKKQSNNSSVETISLNIYSYKKSLEYLKELIDDITSEFILEIQNARVNKRFIYTLLGKDPTSDDYDHDKFNIWEECEFQSSRTFKNLFFENKDALISKINFFNDNKDWYDKEGHPWTFGIGLSGPPGTGKTSIIKCIANMINRHLIVIPLNKIKTQREFSQYYFENTYNRNNDSGSITFDNKIVVFEDIDCMTDIVKKRNNSKDNNSKNSNIFTDNDTTSTNNLLKKIIRKLKDDDTKNNNNNNNKKINNNNNDNYNDEYGDDFFSELDNDFNVINKNHSKTGDDKLTLSFLLNIIDGIRETPGRILIITSNNYDTLDEALTRPGRIDYTLNMTNASKSTIGKMFNHYYGQTLNEYCDETNLSKIEMLKDNVLSPAEIVNIKLGSNTPDEFIDNLVAVFTNKVGE